MSAFAKPNPVELGPTAPRMREEKLEDDALVHAELIEQAWEETAAARAVVEELDRYEAVADLRSDWQTPNLSFPTWRDLTLTYVAWATRCRERGGI